MAAGGIFVADERELRLATGGVVVLWGCWILITRKHPRFLARVPPSRLVL